MRLSLHARQLLAASAVLTLFLGLTGMVLDRAYRTSSEEAQRERLTGHIYALLAATNESESGLELPNLLTDPRFNNPESGLYAEVTRNDGSLLWRSASLVGERGHFARSVASGEWVYYSWHSRQTDEYQVASFGITWESGDGREERYHFSVAEDIRPLLEQQQAFRNTLWLWLGGLVVLLFLAQWWVLRKSLQPLRDVADELADIEAGLAGRLQGQYPIELSQLTDNINSLIQHAEVRQKRVRNSLDDLAHSMKTPLAILQGVADVEAQFNPDQRQMVKDQVARMNDIVSHQLQRASVSGRSALVKAVPLLPFVEQVCRSLAKVYADKPIEYQLEIAADLQFEGDQGDLMEVLGNLLDNAWKYGRSQVSVSARRERGLQIVVEDDGPGIAESEVKQVLQRGQRLDQSQPGQGIGLAMVHEIVVAYGGEVGISRSALGGAAVFVTFP